MNNDHVHPLFADILYGLELQPLQLKRALDKAAPRRLTGEPQTGFGDLRTREERAADEAEHFQEMQDADRRMESDT